MSHEEPDIPPDRPPPLLTPARTELRGEINAKAIIIGTVVAALMGASYPYMVMKLGFGPNVSVVAAFFGFLLLKGIDLVFGTRDYNRWQNNVVEAAGTSAAQVAFMCVLLGAFDLLHKKGLFDIELHWYTSFLWLTAACSLGVLLAVPLRRHFVVDEQLPFVDGLSTAETVIVLDPPADASAQVRRNAWAAAQSVLIGVGLSAFIMFIREDARLMDLIFHWNGMPEGWSPTSAIDIDVVTDTGAVIVGSYTLAGMGVGISWSLLSIGSGMLVGFRVNFSMVLGGIMAWVIAPYFLIKYGQVSAKPIKKEVLYWVMWPATGMLVAGGLTALALRWRLLVSTFTSLRSAKIGNAEFPMAWVGIGVGVCSVGLCVIQYVMLDMPIWQTLAAIVLSLPLMLVGLRVLGETNWGPISALSNMMQGLFALVAPHSIGSNLVASGTTGTIATSSEAIMQDYKCGEIIQTKPRVLTMMQLMAVPIGALCVSLIYPALTKTYGEVGGEGLPSPISTKWAGFAELLQEGIGALKTSAFYALIVFSVLGVVLTVLEAQPKLKKWVPSPTGIGIGILVPFSVVFTMFLGGVAGWLWERTDKKSADLYLVPFSSGLIAGEALVAVIGAIVLFAAG